MLKKKSLILLGLGYLGGMAIALKFHKKTAESLKQELSQTDKKCEVFWKHIVQIHKALFMEAKGVVLSPENMEKLKEYKAKLLAEVEEFRKEAEAKMKEWEKKGLMKTMDIEKELKKIYDNRMILLEQAKQKGEHLIEDALEHGKKAYEEAKNRLHDALEEIKKEVK
jgi:molecular chaperone DnaK (HSP70)